MSIGRLASILIFILFIAVDAAPEGSCVSSSQRYAGTPMPDTYIVTVVNQCDEARKVTVEIYDVTTMEVLKEETFPLEKSQSRAVSFKYTGERLFGYSLYHEEL